MISDDVFVAGERLSDEQVENLLTKMARGPAQDKFHLCGFSVLGDLCI